MLNYFLKTAELLQSSFLMHFLGNSVNFEPFWSPNSAKTGPNNLTSSRNVHRIELYKIFKIVDHLIIFTALVLLQKIFLVVSDPLKSVFR